MIKDSRYAGLDGCRGGWILCCFDNEQRNLKFELLTDLPNDLPDRFAMLAVDMPIGLPNHGRRQCDLEARALLPGRLRSRIFLDLRRPLLECNTFTQANRLAREDGHGLSKQAWNLHPALRSLDAILTPARQAQVIEAHPELVFHRLNDWQAVAGKKTAAGQHKRLDLLAEAGMTGVGESLPHLPRKLAAMDDFLDAAACALAAAWHASGKGRRVPTGSTERDQRGLLMEIHY
ncbi:DUF429 domain-containing protein [Fodinicurvata sediminis]|uniref:DUF429 domain-containing protein n=1 Tax=Fodinicurvata sediminis TaxID=1121832 RepID=UPI0003B3096B|nr:DUF429 domain-containing protein [Fodinicurvata sediminis]